MEDKTEDEAPVVAAAPAGDTAERVTAELAKSDAVIQVLRLRLATACEERDDARHIACETSGRSMWAGLTPSERASEYGWGYLFDGAIDNHYHDHREPITNEELAAVSSDDAGRTRFDAGDIARSKIDELGLELAESERVLAKLAATNRELIKVVADSDRDRDQTIAAVVAAATATAVATALVDSEADMANLRRYARETDARANKAETEADAALKRASELYTSALARAALAADPNFPASEDGRGEWDIGDVATVVAEVIEELQQVVLDQAAQCEREAEERLSQPAQYTESQMAAVRDRASTSEASAQTLRAELADTSRQLEEARVRDAAPVVCPGRDGNASHTESASQVEARAQALRARALREKLAEAREQRDHARRMVCEMDPDPDNQPWDTVDGAAQSMGWGYLVGNFDDQPTRPWKVVATELEEERDKLLEENRAARTERDDGRMMVHELEQSMRGLRREVCILVARHDAGWDGPGHVAQARAWGDLGPFKADEIGRSGPARGTVRGKLQMRRTKRLRALERMAETATPGVVMAAITADLDRDERMSVATGGSGPSVKEARARTAASVERAAVRAKAKVNSNGEAPGGEGAS